MAAKIESWRTYKRWNVSPHDRRSVKEILESHGFRHEAILDNAKDSYHYGVVQKYLRFSPDAERTVYRVGVSGIEVFTIWSRTTTTR